MIAIIGFIGFILGIVFMSALRVVLFRIDKKVKEYKQQIEDDIEFRNILAERELENITANG